MTERDPLVLIQESLDDAEVRQFLDEAARRWPRTDGAHVADVLEMTTDHDMFLELTEPFFETHVVPGPAPTTAVLHLLIIMGRELTVDNLVAVLSKAGLMPVPALPWHRAVVDSVQIGWEATGAEYRYLVARDAAGRGYVLTRWRRDADPGSYDAMRQASVNALGVDTAERGKRLADGYEAGTEIPGAPAWRLVPRLEVRPGETVRFIVAQEPEPWAHQLPRPEGELHPIEPVERWPGEDPRT